MLTYLLSRWEPLSILLNPVGIGPLKGFDLTCRIVGGEGDLARRRCAGLTLRSRINVLPSLEPVPSYTKRAPGSRLRLKKLSSETVVDDPAFSEQRDSERDTGCELLLPLLSFEEAIVDGIRWVMLGGRGDCRYSLGTR